MLKGEGDFSVVDGEDRDAEANDFLDEFAFGEDGEGRKDPH